MAMTRAGGSPRVPEWDRYDRLLVRTDPLGRTTRYSDDSAGDLLAITRPDGRAAHAEYNDLGLPVTVTEPDGAVWRQEYVVWRQEYDERGNLTALTDPAGATTSYGYDERGTWTRSPTRWARSLVWRPMPLPSE